MRLSSFAKLFVSASLTVAILSSLAAAQQTVTGQAPFADYSHQKPGVRRKITLADLPEPKHLNL